MAGKPPGFTIDFVVDPTTDCWVWQRAKTNAGYAETWNGERPVFAHRVYYEVCKGSIPSQCNLDHLCRNRACVNPDHLEAVTPGENNRRGSQTKLDWEKVTEIRRRSACGERHRDLAREFGVAACSISHITHRRTWIEGT